MAHLENWSLRDSYRAFTFPVNKLAHVMGVVTNHPLQSDGKLVITSRVEVLDIAARTAITKSGTNYTLGQMDREYESWLLNNASSH